MGTGVAVSVLVAVNVGVGSGVSVGTEVGAFVGRGVEVGIGVAVGACAVRVDSTARATAVASGPESPHAAVSRHSSAQLTARGR